MGHRIPFGYLKSTSLDPIEICRRVRRPSRVNQRSLDRAARFHPRKIYGLLMKTAADALQKLVRDPRYAGARIGALAVLS